MHTIYNYADNGPQPLAFRLVTLCVTCSGLMVSEHDSGASGPGSSPGQRHNVLCSWARHFTLTVPLSTQVYKWVPANLTLGGNPVMD